MNSISQVIRSFTQFLLQYYVICKLRQKFVGFFFTFEACVCVVSSLIHVRKWVTNKRKIRRKQNQRRIKKKILFIFCGVQSVHTFNTLCMRFVGCCWLEGYIFTVCIWVYGMRYIYSWGCTFTFLWTGKCVMNRINISSSIFKHNSNIKNHHHQLCQHQYQDDNMDKKSKGMFLWVFPFWKIVREIYHHACWWTCVMLLAPFENR